eukprot:3937456-Rhodomonas_salina.3
MLQPIRIGRGATLWPEITCVGRTFIDAGTQLAPHSRVLTDEFLESGGAKVVPDRNVVLCGIPAMEQRSTGFQDYHRESRSQNNP